MVLINYQKKRMWTQVNKNQNNKTEISVLNISLKIPKKLKPVIESLCRITDRESLVNCLKTMELAIEIKENYEKNELYEK